jgi:predicted dehydrogenase
MGDKLQVAVVGVGGIAGAHMPGWKASEDAELVAGCDLNAEALAKWGAEHGVEKLYADVEDLWRDDTIDIVDICTPNRYHAPLSIAALEAGKHVMCEKPLAPTPEEIRQMIAARDKAGKLLMTAQSARFAGNARAFKEEVDQGALGEVYHARCWTLRRAGVPVGPGFIQKKHSGGGPCIDMGVHMLDLALWWMGNPQPVSVSGIAVAPLAHQQGAFSEWGRVPIPPEYDVEDFAAGFVRLIKAITQRANTTIAPYNYIAMVWDRMQRNVSNLPVRSSRAELHPCPLSNRSRLSRSSMASIAAKRQELK